MIGFGSLLKDYLDYYKITTRDFANRLSINNKHLNDIINGKVGISNKLMVNISLITNIDIKVIEFSEKQRIVHNYLYSKFNNDKSINKFLNKLHLNELVDSGNLKLKNSTNIIQNAIDLFDYLNINYYELLAQKNFPSKKWHFRYNFPSKKWHF